MAWSTSQGHVQVLSLPTSLASRSSQLSYLLLQTPSNLGTVARMFSHRDALKNDAADGAAWHGRDCLLKLRRGPVLRLRLGIFQIGGPDAFPVLGNTPDQVYFVTGPCR
ncbi:hypothetical protein R1flu_028607 [Riccia fluitans]|uniref:Uncharacterized protein n=1 Tax=Riccia fluitans TaxID=41844 RepID=A0ABD1XMN8_9MARC